MKSYSRGFSQLLLARYGYPSKAEFRMPPDLKEELAVPSSVEQLTHRRPAKWKPTKDERPRVEGQVLGSFLPLLSDELDGFELLKAALVIPIEGRTD